MMSPLYAGLLDVISILLSLYGYVLVAVAVISWIPDLSESRFGLTLNRMTEPYLLVFRRRIPALRLGSVQLEISFIVAVVVYFLLQEVVVSVLSAVVKGPMS